jgi:hypothetical protein
MKQPKGAKKVPELDAVTAAVLRHLVQLDGKITAMISLQSAILAHLTGGNKLQIGQAYMDEADLNSLRFVESLRAARERQHRPDAEEP